MKKIISLILVMIIMMSMGSQTMVYASGIEEKEICINIFGRMGIPSTTLSSGETVNIIDNDGYAFYVPSGAKVSFTVNLKSTATIELGYSKNGGSKVKKYSGTGKNHTTNFTMGSSGYYKFYITNKSSTSITISGGSLTF